MNKKIRGLFKSIIMHHKLMMMPVLQKIVKYLSAFTLVLSIAVILSLIYSFGFKVSFSNTAFFSLFLVAFYSFLVEYTIIVFGIFSSDFRKSKKKSKSFFYVMYVIVFLLSLIWLFPTQWLEAYIPFTYILRHKYLMMLIVTIESLLKLSTTLTRSLSNKWDPQWIMVISFIFLIVVGTGLLLLPRSTFSGISVIDALFVTVSSVCVTGLTPIDVPTTFTFTGQIILLFLIQLGGIGIMTFTSFFGLMLNGSHTAKNKMFIKDLIDPDNNVSQIFTTLRNIIFITFLIELLGALCIYNAIGDKTLYGFYVALFHAVSAFCNAGISIIPDGLYNVALRDNYAVLHAVAWLIILGGIGFPILFNLWQWIKSSFKIFIRRISGRFYLDCKQHPRILTSNTIIVLTITATLIIVGGLIFLITERNNAFEGKSLWGRYSLAFFMSVTPRTAGFNAFQMGTLNPLTVITLILLMWVGGSPMSTAGGIKTTTLGIALLNVWNTLRGRDQIEIRRRTIASQTTNKAFIIMFVSLVVITTGVFIISILQPEATTISILFEVVSAFSTVGLSLDLTPTLCVGSKIVLICTMFIGRMGLLTILGCFISKDSAQFYEYPSEHIPIN